MVITLLVFFLWLFFMMRSCFAEYRYYQSVKYFEPEIWQKIGQPSALKMPFVFISTNNQKRLNEITDARVISLKNTYRNTGKQFLFFVILILTFAIIYFKIA